MQTTTILVDKKDIKKFIKGYLSISHDLDVLKIRLDKTDDEIIWITLNIEMISNLYWLGRYVSIYSFNQ